MNELDIQSTKVFNAPLSSHDEIQSQGTSNLHPFNGDFYFHENIKIDSTMTWKANNKGEIKFGKCLSCDKFHFRNACAFRNAKCFKYGKIEHIQSVCGTTVHFASSGTKPRNLDPINSDVPNDH
ncbi:unnamed protein product [Schistosoma mattheei]|uniref:Uncharacterized protein n=1 Tax=Schistosoma mattheei TaxID=31246 RepID=A0AA85BL84_9TREM|nr:unnamed protein product [Schistosoma mattheei]